MSSPEIGLHILRRPLRTLPASQGKVRVHSLATRPVQCRYPVPDPGGSPKWLKQPASPRQQEDERLIGLVKQSWLGSGAVYGYRKIHRDRRDAGEACGKHRVAKLMRREGLRSQTGYQRRKGHYGGKSPQAAPNTLARQFKTPAPTYPG